MKHPLTLVAAILLILSAASAPLAAAGRIPLHVERPVEGAPLTFGIPFPQGALDSGDHVRVVTPDGREVPSQVTEVSSWAPADESVKWIWVCFFAGRSSDYALEFGRGVRRAPLIGETNYPLDYWNTLKQPAGTKDLGIGHRHAPQHWTHGYTLPWALDVLERLRRPAAAGPPPAPGARPAATRPPAAATDARFVAVDANVYDPLLGRTFNEIGAEARSYHKCQGTGQSCRFRALLRRAIDSVTR